MRTRSRHRWAQALVIGSFAILILAFLIRLYLLNPTRGLPYHDLFSEGKITDWVDYGGTWNVEGNSVVNDSDERGAKLVTGSSYWTDYVVSADMKLLGNGDAGLIVRANNFEGGIDSYSGYFAGIRTSDASIVLGRANYGWIEFPPKPMPGGVKPLQTYHLEVAVHNCMISFTATAIDSGKSENISVNDPGCPPSGKIGLRSMAAGGIWSNVRVRALTSRDLEKFNSPLPPIKTALYPTNQGLYPRPNATGTFTIPRTIRPDHPELREVQPIRSLRLLSTSRPAMATIRGTVVLTTPKVFIQDATGGVEVAIDKNTSLKVGDQVELGGEVYPGVFRTVLRNVTLYSVGAPDPTPPLSVTADQAATGSFDGMFIEIEGRLTNKTLAPQNTLTLDLSAGNQKFTAVLDSAQAKQLFDNLEISSTLRLHGICVVDSAYTHDTTPFALLMRSYGGIDLVAGPPWWTTNHLISIAAGLIAVLFLGTIFYSRAEQWRLRAVLRERERLAHEIHDTLAQSFAGIGFQLRGIRKLIARETVDTPALLQQIDLTSELVRHSHNEARRSIAALRPEAIPPTGLLDALKDSARRLVDRGTVTIEALEHGEPFPLPLPTLDGLFRIGQEAIANAIQHGHPSQLKIIVNYSKNQIQLIVEDNGKGFLGDTEFDGFGLIGMRRRAERLNGTLEIKSELNKGTSVTITARVQTRFILDDWLAEMKSRN